MRSNTNTEILCKETHRRTQPSRIRLSNQENREREEKDRERDVIECVFEISFANEISGVD